MTHEITIDGSTITTPRLRLRPWQRDDAVGALDIYGSPEVSRWLAPAMDHVEDLDQMRNAIDRWIAQPLGAGGRPSGRWVIEETETGRIAGSGQILPLPPLGADLELGYQLAPWAWGRGFAAEAGHALAHYAFTNGEQEVFAVVRPKNDRGAHAARRIGMEWVGETEKYYDLRLQVFRLRKADLDISSLKPRPVER
ncbi:RimJ/RimL family protein N-acetyltransferase [Nocardioides sp. BE266]|uniref:GNAT family N-acetyltransferase n=1 Tax=Nocardioides sp. BE266 TaxID=2817725 RepID=UPI002863115E|nr:GNAT family N-acetyltransferase [Nocardioides sp. BE266]MDR7255017.1 RimJ/RimL family protein N-acetyltransferase [Nocardioides sp. BE266]